VTISGIGGLAQPIGGASVVPGQAAPIGIHQAEAALGVARTLCGSPAVPVHRPLGVFRQPLAKLQRGCQFHPSTGVPLLRSRLYLLQGELEILIRDYLSSTQQQGKKDEIQRSDVSRRLSENSHE